MKKKNIIIIVSLVLVVALSVGGVLIYRHATKGPELSGVKERFVYLIEGSKHVNEIFFGEGLPAYERDGDLDEENKIYIGESNKGYEKIMELSPYASVEQMKELAQYYYSSAYCDEIFESCLDGVLHEGMTVLDYIELNGEMYQSGIKEPLVKHEKMYLYNTMKIVRPSNEEYVNLEISAYYENKPNEIFTEKLSFAFEDGNWYLDTPTY